MWKIIPISLLQSLLLAAGQLMLKFALNNMSRYHGFWSFIGAEITNWWWMACGITLTLATILWMFILKRYEFSVAFPLSCMSFVFGMIGSMLFLGEPIPLSRWIGMAVILIGSILISR